MIPIIKNVNFISVQSWTFVKLSHSFVVQYGRFCIMRPDNYYKIAMHYNIISFVLFLDVDECTTSISHCPENQVCQNFPGGSTCLCTSNRYGENCTTRK